MPRQPADPNAPVEKVHLTPRGKEALDHLRVLMQLPGYQSITEAEVLSDAIVAAYDAQIAKLNSSHRRGQQ